MSIEIYVRGPDMRTRGMLTTLSKLSLIQRRNRPGKWIATLGSSVDAEMLEPGCGVLIKRDGVTLASGSRWSDYSVTRRGVDVEYVIGGHDDTAIMDALCWPRPGSPIAAQTDRDHVLTGTATNRIRRYFQANVVERRGTPGAHSGPGLSLGPTGTSRARMANLLDLAEEIAGRHISYRVIQQPNGDRMLEMWEPADLRLAVQFSPEIGNVHGWSVTDAGPEATHAVVGAGGEGADRFFRSRVASDANDLVGSRPVDWGGLLGSEVFVDARDIQPDSEDEDGQPIDMEAEADARADAALVEARRKQTFSLDVSDLPGQRWGEHYRVGDLVRAYITPTEVLDDLVEEVEVTWDSDGSERTVVHVGPTDDPQERNSRRERDTRARLRRIETDQ